MLSKKNMYVKNIYIEDKNTQAKKEKILLFASEK